jgi:hypothetical protein
MGWLLETIWWLICALLDFVGVKYHPITEEIKAKPKDNVI